jgi:hypothetical protein
MRRFFLIGLLLLVIGIFVVPAAAQSDDVLEVYITGINEATQNWFRDTPSLPSSRRTLTCSWKF